MAAHGVADSAAPSGTAVVLLAVLAATIGGLAATISRTADVRVLLGLLATGQLVGHLMLSAAGHSHGEPMSPAPAMLVAHALAVVAGAVLIAAGDRLCRAVSRVVEGGHACRRPADTRAGRSSSPAPISLCVRPFFSPHRCHIGVRRSAAHADRPNPDIERK